MASPPKRISPTIDQRAATTIQQALQQLYDKHSAKEHDGLGGQVLVHVCHDSQCQEVCTAPK